MCNQNSKMLYNFSMNLTTLAQSSHTWAFFEKKKRDIFHWQSSGYSHERSKSTAPTAINKKKQKTMRLVAVEHLYKLCDRKSFRIIRCLLWVFFSFSGLVDIRKTTIFFYWETNDPLKKDVNFVTSTDVPTKFLFVSKICNFVLLELPRNNERDKMSSVQKPINLW